MNTKKKTIEEIIGHKEYCGVFISSYCDCGTAQAITEIQALTAEAIPEKKKHKENCPYKWWKCECGYSEKNNKTIDTITTALIERGLLKGKEE